MEITENPCVAIHGEMVAGESARLRRELESLVDFSNRSKFDIAETAYMLKRNGDFGEFATFQEYSKTLKIKPRTIKYLTRIAEVMDQVGIYRNQYEPLGIAKLREITSLKPGEVWKNPETQEETPITDFITGLVQRGHTTSLDDIKQYVRTLKGFVGENDIVHETITMLRSVRDSAFRPAMELAKQGLGSAGKDDEGVSQDASDGRAIEVISVSFLNDPANGSHFEQLTEEEENDE